MPIFGWMPGADKHSIAEREIQDLNETRTGAADRVGAWNWQDDFGAWLAGTNKEEILRLAKIKADQALMTEIKPLVTRNSKALGHLTPVFQGVDGVQRDEVLALLEEDKLRGKNLESLKATNPNIKLSDISKTASSGDIQAVGVKATKADTAATKQADIDRQEGYAEVARQDRLSQQAWQRHQAEEAQRYREFEAAQSRKERAAQRADNKELAMIKLAESKAERLYRRESDERAIARADKKDRQLALMQMIKGLSQLGYSISI